MNRWLAFVGIFALLCCSAQGSSILGDLLTLEGEVDTINDNSRAQIFDVDQDDMLSVGDEIVGILQFEKVNDSDPSPAGLYGVFAFKVTADRSLGGAIPIPIQDHGAIPSAEAHSLKSLLDPALQPAAFTNWDNAVIAFVEIPSLGANDPKDPFSLVNSQPLVDPMSVISNVMTVANGYSLDAITGFGKDDDFLSTMANIAAGLLIGNKDGVLKISEITADNSGNTVMTEKAGLSVLYDVFGGVPYLPLSIENYDAANPTQHDIILTPDGAIQTSTTAAPNWDLEDDSNFQINPVPEPGTLTLWISVLAAIGLVRMRQR